MESSNKQILLFGAVCTAFAIYYFSIDNKSEVVVPNSEVKKVESKVDVKKPTKSVEILYLDSDEKPNKTKKDVQSSIKKAQVVSDEDYQDDEYIQDYIKKNNLQNITLENRVISENQKPRFNVYSNVTIKKAKENRDKFVPPSAPMVINSTFESGQPYTVVIDSDVYNQADEIIITDNNPDGTVAEMVKLSSNKNSEENNDNVIIAPPTIGN